MFAEFGCRGFSCGVALNDAVSSVKRGVKLEWAIPMNLTTGVCAFGADTINATMVRDGIRCICPQGFVGDGFAHGPGCMKCELFVFSVN